MAQPRGTPSHLPVFLDRVLALLRPALAGRPAVAVDGTVGLGGHAAGLLAEHPQLTVVGIDRDPDALREAGARLAGYGPRVRLEHAVYDQLPVVLDRLGLAQVDAVLLDLGVSSMQLDKPERGFSYARDAPLDMRMDPTAGRTAEDVINDYSTAELSRVLREYGEERFASRITAAIVRARAASRLTSSARLAELVRDAIPAPARRSGGNPAKRTFQALRIEVNAELTALAGVLPAALAALRPGGRIIVLSYHSLEDRLVKQAFAAQARGRTPAGLPVELAGHGPLLRLLTRGAEQPDAAQVAANPRAGSAKLRAAERLAGGGAEQ